jgi:NAD+ synthase
MSQDLKICVAQLNPAVGDLDGNLKKIVDGWRSAKQEGADLLMTTEFSLTGYPLEDLVEIRDFLDLCEDKIEELCQITKSGGPGLLVGAPYFEGYDENDRPVIYNAVYLIEDGAVTDIVKKTHLPNYGVFDEKRNFNANKIEDVRPVDFRGHKLGVLVCEDTWFPDVSKKLADEGAEILLSLNASPYEGYEKFDRRVREVVGERAKETGLDVVYANQVGGQDELVFDGGSFAVSLTKSGELKKVFQAATMREDRTMLRTTKVDGKLRINEEAKNIKKRMSPEEELYQALVLGTRDYIQKSGFTDVVLGLSGGIDSGLVAAIAVDALGPDHVHLVRLPSQYTSSMSNDDADIQAKFLGVQDIREIAISEPVQAMENVLASSFKGKPEDVTEENLQSRMRGTLLMALSNKFGWMLLSTGNKSEVSVGYCTLYGDTNGGFNPLKDVYKTDVRKLCEWRNQNIPEGVLGPKTVKFDKDAGRDAIVMPWNIITRPPSAELKDGQEDSQSLPDYDVLDDILKRRIEGAQSRQDIIDAGYDEAVVDRILKLMKIAVYKQNQAPPGVKTTRRGVRGKDLRLPIANKFNPGQPRKPKFTKAA